MNILITGGAGYIGGMLINKLINDQKVSHIISIDLLPKPESIKNNNKLTWVQADLATTDWKLKAVEQLPIDVIIHAAFKIRNPLGKTKLTGKNNMDASNNIFHFCFENKINKLIHLSTVSSYGAKVENIGKLLKEDSPLIENEAPYGYQKKIIEENLNQIIKEKNPSTEIFILRLNSVTGPLGQSLKSKFGLITFLKKLMPFIVETNPYWARQFVHENDVRDIIIKLIFNPLHSNNLSIYNIAPSSFLTAKDMANLLNKNVIKISPWMAKILFFLAWYLSLGKIPTRPDSVSGLVYPINVDGTRINEIGYSYQHTAREAFMAEK